MHHENPDITLTRSGARIYIQRMQRRRRTDSFFGQFFQLQQFKLFKLFRHDKHSWFRQQFLRIRQLVIHRRIYSFRRLDGDIERRILFFDRQ